MRFEPAARLGGELSPPPDKSISHRAALVAGMCERPVRISNYLRAADTDSTLAAVASLGADVTTDDGEVTVRGVGLRGARGDAAIDVGNAGTLLRMLPGWLAGQPRGRWTLDGDASIRRRPVDRVAAPLRLMGARVQCRDERLPPLTVEGSALRGIDYELPVASAQVKSCVLLAGLLAEGATTVREREPTRDHTELTLARAGARVTVERDGPLAPATVTVEPAAALDLDELAVPADFSSAAFFLAAAAIVPGAEVTVQAVGVNPTRTGLLTVMREMGADIEIANERSVSREAVADVTLRHSPLRATRIERGAVPLLIDELPLVALLGAFAEGTTAVSGAEELRHKESDRIATVVAGMGALGARIEAQPDGFAVEGGGGLRGGAIDAAGDHRLAMLGAVAGVASREGVEVRGFEAVEISYPGFAEDLRSLGA